MIYFSCSAKNPYGIDLRCSWIDIVTELPADDSSNAKIIIGSVVSTGIIMIFAFILILYYALNQKKKRKEMKNAAREVVLWAKRVTVTTDEQRYDNSNGSMEVQVISQCSKIRKKVQFQKYKNTFFAISKMA